MKTNKITMIVSDRCPKCKVMEKRLRAIVEKHEFKAEFKLLPVGTEAAEFAITWGLDSVPAVVINSKPFNVGDNIAKVTDDQLFKAMRK